jgi:hypothetical protein
VPHNMQVSLHIPLGHLAEDPMNLPNLLRLVTLHLSPLRLPPQAQFQKELCLLM